MPPRRVAAENSKIAASSVRGPHYAGDVQLLASPSPGARRTEVASMRAVEPEVFLVSRPDLDYDAIGEYLRDVGGESWVEKFDKGELNDAQNLAELAGRLCYKSWEPALNANVTKVRTDQPAYLQ